MLLVDKYTQSFFNDILLAWPHLSEDDKLAVGESVSLDMGSGEIASLINFLISQFDATRNVATTEIEQAVNRLTV